MHEFELIKKFFLKLSNCNKAIVSLNKVLKEFLSIRVPSAKLRYQEIIFELLPVLTSDFSRNLELFVCFIQNTISSSDFRAAGLLIGPEGGFANEELDQVDKLGNVCRVSLGNQILRSDTAAVAALACWQAVAGDWR